MNSVQVQSPTRVDLAGGTLDLWPLANFVGGATTINLAIDIWTKAEIFERPGTEIEIESMDLNYKKSFQNISDLLESQDPALAMYKPVLKFFNPQKAFSLKTSSQSPVGGGLGGSSSLMISMMKAFSQWTGRSFTDVGSLVNIAHNLESELLNTPTGTQDYYPAVSGGLNILDYSASGIRQEVLEFSQSPISSYFVLVYTGKAHHSGLNNFEVLKAAVGRDPKTMGALQDLKKISQSVVRTFRDQSWDYLPNLFQAEFEARIRLAPAFSCPEIEELHRLSLAHGALAIKICGAGGGGCVMLWVPPQQQERVMSECQKAGFKVLDAKPVDPLKNQI